MPNLRYILVCGAISAALTLSAAYTVWLSKPSGPAALVVTPRQYVPVLPGSTNTFTARLLHNNGTESDVSTLALGSTWSCAPTLGTIADRTLTVTGAVPSFGWVQATCSGLTTRVQVKISADGTWNPDADTDGDGYSDIAEITSNTTPSTITLLDVSCRLRQ
jgi:hypothetical protein